MTFSFLSTKAIKITTIFTVSFLSLMVFMMQMLWYYLVNTYLWYFYYCLFFLSLFIIFFYLPKIRNKYRYGFLGLMAILIGYMPYDVLPMAILEPVLFPENDTNKLSDLTKGLPTFIRFFIDVIFYPTLHFLLFLLFSKTISKKEGK